MTNDKNSPSFFPVGAAAIAEFAMKFVPSAPGAEATMLLMVAGIIALAGFWFALTGPPLPLWKRVAAVFFILLASIVAILGWQYPGAYPLEVRVTSSVRQKDTFTRGGQRLLEAPGAPAVHFIQGAEPDYQIVSGIVYVVEIANLAPYVVNGVELNLSWEIKSGARVRYIAMRLTSAESLSLSGRVVNLLGRITGGWPNVLLGFTGPCQAQPSSRGWCVVAIPLDTPSAASPLDLRLDALPPQTTIHLYMDIAYPTKTTPDRDTILATAYADAETIRPVVNESCVPVKKGCSQ